MKSVVIILFSVLGTYLVYGLILFALYVALLIGVNSNQSSTSSAPAYVASQDQDLLNQLTAIAVDTSNVTPITLKYGVLADGQSGLATESTDENDVKRYEITIDPSTERSKIPTVLAHEYLHIIWYQLDVTSKSNIENSVTSAIVDDDYMKQRVSVYSDTNLLNSAELFSIYCTESPDSKLGNFAKVCNKFINRNSFVVQPI